LLILSFLDYTRKYRIFQLFYDEKQNDLKGQKYKILNVKTVINGRSGGWHAPCTLTLTNGESKIVKLVCVMGDGSIPSRQFSHKRIITVHCVQAPIVK